MDFFHVSLALATVFGLLGLLYLISRRANPGLIARASSGGRAIWSAKFRVSTKSQSSRYLEVIRRVNLTTTHQLHLISTTQEIFLVCTHPHGCTLLRTRDAHAPINDESAAPEGFEQYAI